VRLAVESGVAGLSIEDSTGDPSRPLFELDAAVERVRAARKAIDKAGGDTLLVAARMLSRRPSRHRAHHSPAEGLRERRRGLSLCAGHPHARRDSRGRAGRRAAPVNLLMGWPGELTVRQIADLGVRRISVGGALARSAWGGFTRAAKMLLEQGRFDGFAGAESGDWLDEFFGGRGA